MILGLSLASLNSSRLHGQSYAFLLHQIINWVVFSPLPLPQQHRTHVMWKKTNRLSAHKWTNWSIYCMSIDWLACYLAQLHLLACVHRVILQFTSPHDTLLPADALIIQPELIAFYLICRFCISTVSLTRDSQQDATVHLCVLTWNANYLTCITCHLNESRALRCISSQEKKRKLTKVCVRSYWTSAAIAVCRLPEKFCISNLKVFFALFYFLSPCSRSKG